MKDNTAESRFEESENGLTVFAQYRKADNRYVITHVEADPALRGTGAAPRLMAAIVDHARAAGLQIVPRCSYAVTWFKRHPEAVDVIG